MDLVQEVRECVEKAKLAFAPHQKLHFFAVVVFLKELADVVMSEQNPPSVEAAVETLQTVWQELDDELQIVRRLDDLVKAGIFEVADGPAFRYVIEKVAIPELGHYIYDLQQGQTTP